MDRARYIRELFEAALAQKPEQRERFLREACGDDAELRDSIVALLNADENVHHVFRPIGSPSGQLPEPSGASTMAIDPKSVLRSGQILGHRYRVEKLLGRGGMGEVWLAHDLKLRVDVALKSLRRDRFQDAGVLELLRAEVRTARQVVSPNVCRIFDLIEVDDQEFVSMEYIDGTTLLEVLCERGPLELREATEIASQFLAGLDAIHAQDLVHRDVKPENIMITRSGRVVLMDFGLATPSAVGAAVAGTPAYMAPEALRGEELDARADIFSAGITLAEMVAAEGIRDPESRDSVWSGVRADPPLVPESPWRPVLRRAVSANAAERYASARNLIRALEEISLRTEGGEDLRPYPGLAAFTQENAEYFFGRELEIETVWKRLPAAHLLGLIGPSGAGKTSFVQAGLLPATPPGWSALVCHPGDRPLRSLAEALVPQFAGDADAMREMMGFEDSNVAVALFARWRSRHEEGLLILDQFEELFTLNPPEVQERFAKLLGRLALEADVHVVLSMRDDFLIHCHEHGDLTPIFTELIPFMPPAGADLRRALIQPARLCGFRFEDEALVEEILGEVAEERGALPLAAFAMARWWEERDREQGLLTREAYQRIGGVGGALAKHAEATVSRIGPDRLSIVRELFRNLVTAQGTRTARDVDELLSVFSERVEAEEVLRELVTARLLTSYEAREHDDETSEPRRRVEIIHESLLTAWPRLVRWQTQDADSAQFRDQVRQAAQLWQERNRQTELLWTDSSFREYQLWRDRYAGGLTSTEEAYGKAMVDYAGRRRRRRRFAVTGVIVVLIGVLAVVANLWRQSDEQARRAEAHLLISLGRETLEENPTVTMAHVLASLEARDSPEARRLALESLWQGPLYSAIPAGFLEIGNPAVLGLDFDPDGHWLAIGGWRRTHFLPADGGPWVVLDGGGDPGWSVRLSSDHWVAAADTNLSSSRLGSPKGYRVWSIPHGDIKRAESLADVPASGFALFLFPEERHLITASSRADDCIVESWPLDGGEPAELANLGPVVETPVVDGLGTWLAYGQGKDVFIRSLSATSVGEPRLIGSHFENLSHVCGSLDGRYLASVDQSEEIRMWSTKSDSPILLRTLQGTNIRSIRLNDTGSLLSSENEPGTNSVWDLLDPPASDPRTLTGAERLLVMDMDFHPRAPWLATSGYSGLALWSLGHPYARVFRGRGGRPARVVFSSDGTALFVPYIDGPIVRWALTDTASVASERLWNRPEDAVRDLALAPDESFFVFIACGNPHAQIISLLGGSPKGLSGTSCADNVAVSPDGRLVAVGGRHAEAFVRVWNPETGEVRILDAEDGRWIYDVEFMPDGAVLTASAPGLRLWDPRTGTHRVLIDEAVSRVSVTPDGRRVVAIAARDPESAVLLYSFHDETLREITAHRGASMATLDPTGTVLVSSAEGEVRVSSVTDSEVHLLLGHQGEVRDVAISPDGRWIASAGTTDGTVRLWPMPEGEPFHTLPYDELHERLSAMTNVRVIKDEESPSGYRTEIRDFPGWETTPTW